MRSPIERMVDEACGIKNGDVTASSELVTLVCPKCQRRAQVEKYETDPVGTTEVHVVCDRCNPGDFDVPVYFSADGQELFFADRPTQETEE
jgi:hypothetical protein